MDRLYPVFHFEPSMPASSEGRGQKRVICQREAGDPRVGAPGGRRRKHRLVKSKSLQPQKSLQGLAGIGLQCPLAQKLPQAPILLPSFQGAPVKPPLAK